MNDRDEPDLTTIDMPHFWWHQWAARAAHIFIWVGFLIAVFVALSEGDWSLFAISLMLLGIGLLFFRGVAFFMIVWVLFSSFLSAREIRDEYERQEKD